MTIVFVHGNPETEAIWDDLVPHLRNDDVVRLSPPGFGCVIPSGFDCSTDSYRDWLAGELENLAQPIDLVGHDWGGGHVIRIAMDRPRSNTILDERYLGRLRRGLCLARDGAGLADGGNRRTGGCADARYAGQGSSRAVRELGHDLGRRSESGFGCEWGLGPGNPGAIQIGRSAGDARPRNWLATGSRQTRPWADRDGRFLLRWREARAPFCRARRGKSGRLARSGSLVDVPAASTSGGRDQRVLG